MIWAALLETAKRRAGAPAVIGDGVTLTFGALVERVGQEAARLPPRPETSGPARVFLIYAEPVTLLVRVLACWSVGMVPVLLREGQTAESLRRIGEAAAPIATLSDDGASTSTERAARHHLPFGPRDEALVICTSGTTGTPKLVALPAEGLVTTARAIARDLKFGPGDIIAAATPLTYMYALMGAALSGLLAGAAVRFFAPGLPLTVVQAAIRREDITVMQGPPSLMRLFLAYWTGTPFPSVRLVTTGGEFLVDRLLSEIARAFPQADFRFLYGMTEAGPRISHTPLVSRHGAGVAVGHPFPHFDWYIEPGAQDGLPAGTGRLAIRGPSIFLGYISPGGGYTGIDKDGYFLSTDLVCQLDDGQLCFLGRHDRLFKTGGKLVNPLDIEDLLMRHPDVRDAACRPEAHRLLGLVPVAEVVLAPGSETGPADLKAFCGALEPHAVPHRIDVLSELALAASGKRIALGA